MRPWRRRSKQRKVTEAVTKEESRVIAQIVNRMGATQFARTLANELRDIADCDANVDTCANECCHVASAIEHGLNEAL